MLILLVLAAGIVAGYFLRSRTAVRSTASTVTTGSLYLLIFLLGLSVGANETVVRALGRLGMQALILSAGAVAGSVLVSWLVSRLFFNVASHEK